MQVVDRLVAAVPADGPGWIDQLELLRHQVAGPAPIANEHLDPLAASLRAALAAVAERGRRLDTAHALWERH
ncbi:MAG: hypothetical protein ACTHMS_09205 [Jatrophihabitans sp.]|uniref:hypothetical protein n=1 Tax=Jatrophihabitans sp. TaxID=1932789 RepID=UPI003F80FA9A